MEVYSEVSVVPEYNNELISYIDNNMKGNPFMNKVSQKFIDTHKNKCVIDIDKLKIPTFNINNYEPIIDIGGDKDDD